MRQKLSQYQIAQRARRAREASVGVPKQEGVLKQWAREDRKDRIPPAPATHSLDSMAEGLLAVALSGPEPRAMLVRIFANLPMPEAYLLARLVCQMGVDGAEFVKEIGRVGNVQSDPKSWR